MDDSAVKLAEKLEKEGRKNVKFFSNLPLDDWDKQVYSDGTQWTVREIFSHIVETEQDIPRLVMEIVNGAEGVPEDFDIDRYNQKKVKQSGVVPVEVLLQNFANLRVWTVEMVSGFSDEDLEKEGRHPFLGLAPVKEMLRLMHLHIQLHIRDIRRAAKGED